MHGSVRVGECGQGRSCHSQPQNAESVGKYWTGLPSTPDVPSERPCGLQLTCPRPTHQCKRQQALPRQARRTSPVPLHTARAISSHAVVCTVGLPQRATACKSELRAVDAVLSLLQAHASDLPLVLRTCFILGNLTTAHDECR